MTGSLVLQDRDGIRVHSYISPEDGWLVNTHIVEGSTRLILFDGQLLNAYAEEVAIYVASLGKPVDRIILSHAHPDHWAGLEALSTHLPQAPIYCLPAVAQTIRERGPLMLAGLQKMLGPAIASQTPASLNELLPGTQTIDSIEFEFREYKDGESELQLVAVLPALKWIFPFDLVFSPDDHLFTTVPSFQNWTSTLEALFTLGGYDCLLLGHNRPTDSSAITATKEYLAEAAQAYAHASNDVDYAARLKQAFPRRNHSAWIEFSGKRLFPTA